MYNQSKTWFLSLSTSLIILISNWIEWIDCVSILKIRIIDTWFQNYINCVVLMTRILVKHSSPWLSKSPNPDIVQIHSPLLIRQTFNVTFWSPLTNRWLLILLTQVTILRWPEYVRIDSKDCKSQNFNVKTADAVKKKIY